MERIIQTPVSLQGSRDLVPGRSTRTVVRRGSTCHGTDILLARVLDPVSMYAEHIEGCST